MVYHLAEWHQPAVSYLLTGTPGYGKPGTRFDHRLPRSLSRVRWQDLKVSDVSSGLTFFMDRLININVNISKIDDQQININKQLL